MKRLITATALLMGLSIAADAAPRLARSNVLTCDGVSASGFTVIGGTVQRFVSEAAFAAHEFCNPVSVVPASVDVYDLAEVTAYLATLGITGAQPVMHDVMDCPTPGLNVRNCDVDPVPRRTYW